MSVRPEPAAHRPGWSDLREELDLWESCGKRASFWWRDDDGGELTPAMERLLDLAGDSHCGLALAVIPSAATRGLADAIASRGDVAVLQHGFRHHNHRRSNGKASEFPAHRDPATVGEELTAGWERLQQLFADQAETVLVPPWGHIAESMVGSLPSCGYHGLSLFDPRPMATVPGLLRVNAHCDLIKWRPAPHFRGESKCLWHLLTHLQGRRCGTLDAEEPTGVLTHAYDLDSDCYAFLEELLKLTRAHPAAEWLHPKDVFPV